MSKAIEILELTENWLLDFGVFGLFTYKRKFSNRFQRSSIHPATDDNALKRFIVALMTILNILALLFIPTFVLSYFLAYLGLNPHLSVIYLIFALSIFMISFADLLLKVHKILSIKS
jgi:hypothetical protein